MINQQSNITGAILAGGKSSRMGTAKAFVRVGEKTMLEHVAKAVKPLVKSLFIIANDKGYDKFGFYVYPDLIENSGPAGGIYTALMHSPTDKIIILSCDVPFITSDLLEYLIQKSSPGFITVPEIEGNIEPLIAVYDKGCLSKLEMIIRSGKLKMHEILNELKTEKIKIPQSKYSYHQFDNINSPQDLSKINNLAS